MDGTLLHEVSHHMIVLDRGKEGAARIKEHKAIREIIKACKYSEVSLHFSD